MAGPVCERGNMPTTPTHGLNSLQLQDSCQKPGMVAHTLIIALGRQRQEDLCKFQTSLVYIAFLGHQGHMIRPISMGKKYIYMAKKIHLVL